MSILEELYYGNINPNEKRRFDHNSERGRFIKIILDNEEALIAFLDKLPNASEEQKLFSQFIDAQSRFSEIECMERFAEGFQIGARFMLDTFLI